MPLSAVEAREALAKVQPGEWVGDVALTSYGKHRRTFRLRRGVIPEGNPLADNEIDVFVATKGVAVHGMEEPDSEYVVGAVAVEHTKGDAPAVADVFAKPLSEDLILQDALGPILLKANVTRALLPPDRANFGSAAIQAAGYEQVQSGAFLVPAAA